MTVISVIIYWDWYYLYGSEPLKGAKVVTRDFLSCLYGSER